MELRDERRRRTLILRLVPPAALLALVALAASGARAQDGGSSADGGVAPDDGGVTAVRDVRVFDGESVTPGGTVVIRGDSIAAVGPDVAVPEGAAVVEGAGRTLLPGLIDAHAHTFAPSMLEASLAFGVTTVLDMFTDPTMAQRWREEQASGGAHGRAHIFSAGVLATAPGGHGTQFGLQIPTIESSDEAASFVEARIEEGSDWLKIVYDDGGLYGLDIPTIDEATLDALVAAAHARGLLAVVHVSTLEAARDAVDAGADGLAHVWSDSVPDRAFVRRMASDGVFVVPTLSVIRSTAGTPGGASLLEDDRIAPLLTASARQQLDRGFDFRADARVSDAAAASSVDMMAEAGVPILAGTDAPNPGTAHGASVHGELERLVEAGLTPTEALRSATSVPARAFGLDGRGRVTPGQRADLLLVQGDPTGDVTRTRAIVAVWKGGERFDRQAYGDRVAAARGEGGGGRGDGGGGGKTPDLPDDATISDFEAGTPTTAFGSDWIRTSDQMMGGSSTAELAVVEGGAAGTSRALRIHGEIKEGTRFAWGGAMFRPGGASMSPVDLSWARGIRFRARGDGGRYRVMLFTESSGRRPLTVSFTAGDAWETHDFPWSDFHGSDGSGVVGVAVVGGPAPGGYGLTIDQVELLE